MNKIKNIIDANVITTNGYNITENTINYIKNIKQYNNIIIFTDPDNVGQRIRNYINDKIPGCYNAYLNKSKAIGNKKIGIEHALDKDILDALNNLITYNNESSNISLKDLYNLKLSGHKDSYINRLKISKYYHIGDTNTKTMIKRLNYLNITKENLKEILCQN